MVTATLVTEEQVEEYTKNGAILLKNVFSEEWIEKVRRGIAKNIEKPSQYSERLTVSNLSIADVKFIL